MRAVILVFTLLAALVASAAAADSRDQAPLVKLVRRNNATEAPVPTSSGTRRPEASARRCSTRLAPTTRTDAQPPVVADEHGAAATAVPRRQQGSAMTRIFDVAETTLEREHVHAVYDAIEPHFSATQYKPWPAVDNFLRSLPPGSLGADIGCGNGKYMGVNKDVMILGSDMYETPRELESLVHEAGGLKIEAAGYDWDNWYGVVVKED
ncbi:hypothetical protein DFJ73DRAFT_797521 [Zopfochytrium polystomum]|nr:hypothetical protein DFJ73DRAFT_797521 [Zopfochytrium polystomum]